MRPLLTRLPLLSTIALSALAFAACGDDDLDFGDAGPDVAPDMAIDASEMDAARQIFCNPPVMRWQHQSESLVPGVTREVRLNFARDFCEALDITISTSPAGILSTPETVHFDPRRTRASVSLTGVAPGMATVTASYIDRIDHEERSVSFEARVTEPVLPTCEGDATGMLTYGGSVALSGTFAGVGVHMPEGAETPGQYHVDLFEAEVSCAADQIPDGYVALGPAITFAPGHMQMRREIPVTIPVELALVPQGRARGHVQVSYTGPGVSEPRVVPVASPDYSEAGLVTFNVPRLGTYQAVIEEGPRGTREREFSYRGIMGVSMGSGGAALIGTHNTELFDFVGPLGGPVDWIQMLNYVREHHMGGFCTEAERQALPDGSAECDQASTTRTPEPSQLFEIDQDFEHWYFEEDYRGQGGTFDRRQYISIFRDLSIMYGNMNTTRAGPGEGNVTPPGVPDSRRAMSDADRCSSPVILPPQVGSDDDPATGFFDDEYNPDGTYPVITFCDGAEQVIDGHRDVGLWEPMGNNNYPVEVALAVDINGNGRRDPGEPLVRQGRENFEDCGLDQLCNPDEAGYDAVTNPDPAGDDYDFQYNPNGTEANWIRDYVGDPVGDCASPMASPPAGTGELFSDIGLDGVAGTPQLAEGGYDSGEGDDCWTNARGVQNMLDNNPRGFIRDQPLEVLHNVDFFSDGGVRDLFNFGATQNQLAGAFGARGLPLSLFNSHAGLLFDGQTSDRDFVYTRVDWSEVGQYVHIRYGDIDADEETKVLGDGGHVGTGPQILNRLLSVMAWMSDRWPGGDRTRVIDNLCPSLAGLCENINQIRFDFTSSLGRTGPTSVVLPPGYFMPENADVRYPVVYLLHGYGMDPNDLLATGIIIWNLMTSATIPEAERLQKMIFVFPDGSCAGDECIKGTFFADAPDGNGGAQMETFALELMEEIDSRYRTRRPETHTVLE